MMFRCCYCSVASWLIRVVSVWLCGPVCVRAMCFVPLLSLHRSRKRVRGASAMLHGVALLRWHPCLQRLIVILATQSSSKSSFSCATCTLKENVGFPSLEGRVTLPATWLNHALIPVPCHTIRSGSLHSLKKESSDLLVLSLPSSYPKGRYTKPIWTWANQKILG